MPFMHVGNILVDIDSNIMTLGLLEFGMFLAVVNSSVKPLAYICMSPAYRRRFIKLLTCSSFNEVVPVVDPIEPTRRAEVCECDCEEECEENNNEQEAFRERRHLHVCDL